jgi:hypothetical protein
VVVMVVMVARLVSAFPPPPPMTCFVSSTELAHEVDPDGACDNVGELDLGRWIAVIRNISASFSMPRFIFKENKRTKEQGDSHMINI